MSIKKSLDKLKQAIYANKPPSFPRAPMPGQLPDGSWDPNCCVKFEGLGTTDPKVYLICNGVVTPIRLSEVAKNAKSCPEYA